MPDSRVSAPASFSFCTFRKSSGIFLLLPPAQLWELDGCISARTIDYQCTMIVIPSFLLRVCCTVEERGDYTMVREFSHLDIGVGMARGKKKGNMYGIRDVSCIALRSF